LSRKIMASNPDPENDLPNAAYISRLDSSLTEMLVPPRPVGRGRLPGRRPAEVVAALGPQAPQQSVCAPANRGGIGAWARFAAGPWKIRRETLISASDGAGGGSKMSHRSLMAAFALVSRLPARYP